MKRETQEAFTLIEMLVVVAIIIVITAVVLANNSRFGGTILLQSLAYDIALSARTAQVYGTAVVRFGVNNFAAPYGIHFEMASPTTYLIFADVKNAGGSSISDGFYQAGEVVQSNTIGRGFVVSQLCATQTGLPEDCSISKLDIVYKRPEPDAYIRANDAAPLHERARVVVSSRGDTLSIYLEANGQISVHN